MKYLIDTDIMIDYLRGLTPAIQFIEKNLMVDSCFLSVITVAELYAGVGEGKERRTLDQFISIFTLIELNQDIAQIGGIFRRDYWKSHHVGLADAIIAATAKTIHAELVTLNIKHYPMLSEVLVPYKKS